MTRRFVAVLALAAVAAVGALAANFALIELATQRDDPVGRLRAVVALDAGAPGLPRVETVATESPSVTVEEDDDKDKDKDEDGNRGRGSDDDD